MFRKLLIALSAAAVLAVPGTAAAARPASAPDTDCLRAGIAVLQANGGVSYFAQNGVPLSLIGGEGTAPLATVFKLHLTQPGLFPWCSV